MFRREAREARETSWLGTIVVSRPMSTVVLSWATGAIVVSALGFLAWGEYTSKARISGLLVPTSGVVKVQAPQAGVILTRAISEGDRVERGDSLMVIGDTRLGAESGDLSRAVSDRLRERLRSLTDQVAHSGAAARAEQLALAQRREGLATELARIDRELDAITNRVALADNELGRSRDLEARGFVSRSYTERRHEDALDQDLRRHAVLRARLAVTREMAAVDSEASLAHARALAQESAMHGQRASLAQERLERSAAYRSVITAPQSGTVAVLLVDAGQAVVPGTPLLTIIPGNSRLEAHLFAPSRSVGFIRMGQEVLLKFPAFPFQKFGAQRARVLTVSRNALPPAELGFTPPDGGREPLYRVKVSLESQSIVAYGRPEPLQAGMLVEADILLDRRRLIEWIFEPLFSLAGRA